MLCSVLAASVAVLVSCDSTTTPATVNSVVVAPAQLTINSLGQSAPLTAIALDAKGKQITGKAFSWQSQASDVVSVNAGMVTAVSNGSATVTATTDGVSGSAVVRVEQTISQVRLSPVGPTLRSLGETVQLTATPLDARDNAVVTTLPVTWSASPSGIVSVDTDGRITAIKDGTSTITARVGAVSGTVNVVVDQTATQLAFVAPPFTTQLGVALLDVRVAVQDALGHIVTKSAAGIALGLGTNPTGAVLAGTSPRAAVNGLATFPGLTIDRLGSGYTLSATSSALVTAMSAPFDVIAERGRIDSVSLPSNLAIGGPPTPYRAWLVNASGSEFANAGVQAWIEQGAVTAAAAGALVRSCGAATGLMSPGPCLFQFVITATNTGGLVPGPATARLDLFVGNDILHSLRFPVTLETYIPPPPPDARIDAITMTATTLPIGGPAVTFSVRVVNNGPTTVSDVVLQGYIDQNGASRPAGGTVVLCGEPLGSLPPGTCTFQSSLIAFNANGGGAVLVPGAAVARLELTWPHGVISTYSLPITLVNPP